MLFWTIKPKQFSAGVIVILNCKTSSPDVSTQSGLVYFGPKEGFEQLWSHSGPEEHNWKYVSMAPYSQNQQSPISPYSRYQPPPKDILGLWHFFPPLSRSSHWNQQQRTGGQYLLPPFKNLMENNLQQRLRFALVNVIKWRCPIMMSDYDVG